MKRLSDVQLNGMEIQNKISAGHSSDDIIQGFSDLNERYQLLLSKYLYSWNVVKEKVIVFYKIDITDCPKITASIKIYEDLTVEVFTKYGKIGEDCLELFLNPNCLLIHWSQLRNLLIYFGSDNAISSNESIEYYITEASALLNCCIASITEEDDYSNNIKQKLIFLNDQLALLKSKKYSQDTIDLAYSIYLKSSTCYKAIQKLGILNIPNEKKLLRIVSSVVSEETSDEDINN